VKWLLLAIVVLATAISDLLFSWDMKRHGEVDEFRPGVLARVVAGFLKRLPVLAAVFFLAISFVAFLELLKIADLSFAVPASAASLVLETLLARTLLREPVRWQRWCGTALVAAGVILIAL
jgi:drug/metabolite transporter (DMT)-like permease